ncbi:hypothetical protein Q7C_804 [Methylophaga frappieri]|uniref:Uncharacterized protein n=1 Tax=Methylophaga frappieri (strain ATCC BAA-2434 / DSM 25690 / JAM7) TaxID=754477 RepID=I1YGD0_METFJ|nr:hypothetical protein [Methylophaga frappieri]AFJ01973.1 hypothetical protein Q7C_804 [Methylophaga frappieri]
MAQDKSASDLLALLIDLPEGVGRSLIVYMGLFRSSSRDLANDRALRLANEVLELSDDKSRLAVAMNETVQAMRIKQDEGSFKPLTNHNYLKRVIETVSVSSAVNTSAGQLPAAAARQSKSAMTIDMLKNYPNLEGIDEWFTKTICGAMAEMMLMGLENVPAYDTIPMVVDRFISGMWPKRNWDRKNHFRGENRLYRAFMETAETTNRWPSIKDVLSLIPSQ